MSNSIKNGWEVKKLGDLELFVSDGNYSEKYPREDEFCSSGIPFIRANNIKNNTVIDNDMRFISYSKHSELKKGHLKVNDLLITTRGNIGLVGLVPLKYDGANINAQIVLLRLNGKKYLSEKYLLWVLQESKVISQFNKLQTGSALKQLPIKKLMNIEIQLPPIEEQIKIAEILEKADNLRQKRKESNKLYDELLQSIFFDMFGELGENTKNWNTILLENCILDIITGVSLGGEERAIKNDEFAILKISSVTSGTFNPNEYKVINNSDLPKKLVNVKKNDLLFSRANTRELVGATCIVDKDYNNLLLPDKIWNINLDIKLVDKFYIKYLLTYDPIRDKLRKEATGSSGSMLNISQVKLKNLEIPVPPIELQNKFAEIVEKIEVMKEKAKKAEQEIENLFNALMQKAFNGEL